MLPDQRHVFEVAPFCVVRDHMCYCAEHNQHAQHAKAWDLGTCPQENFKNRCSEIESEGISESKYCQHYRKIRVQ